MNALALEKLEFYEIINRIKDYCISDIAKAEVGKIEPSCDYDKIKVLLDEQDEALNIVKKTSSAPLHSLTGIDLIMQKLEKSMSLNERELSAMSDFLRSNERMIRFMNDKENLAPRVSKYASSMYILDEIREEIDRCIVNERVDDKASSTLDKIRNRKYIAEGRIKSKLAEVAKRYQKYLVYNIVSMKNERYVLAVRNEYRGVVPGLIVCRSQTGSTLYIEPEAINILQGEINRLMAEEEAEIYQILTYLSSLLMESISKISINVETMVCLDVLFAKAKYANSVGGRKVKVNASNITKINQGKHPMLGADAVPLDFSIGEDYTSLVITGPNTGGKTVALKTIGLLTMMVQSGILVPVGENSEFAIFSDIFVDIGDNQSIEQNLSTFSSHMKNIIDIMKVANKYTLVLLDELGSGTDPVEGEGLAIGILKYLHSKGGVVVSTSHYAKIKDFAHDEDGVMNGRMTFDDETLKPMYRLIIGESGESNAFNIALKLGMNCDVLESAYKITYGENKEFKPIQMISVKCEKNYEVAKKQKIKETPNILEKEEMFKIGDLVNVTALNKYGVVFALENKVGDVGVMVHDKKIYINKKRLKLHIEAKELYPEDYDMDIIFETKENRKKDKIMNRKYVKGLKIERKDC
ncbi:MAG: hypothetical protein A2Y24_02120 [Clostridiales bacterium GWE2_32_10]|nr:MAG: hypothetical protein A2Y24_02120 [Clostridiales bacterium GWE2_32_10]